MIAPVMLARDLAAWRMLYLGAREVCPYPAVQHKAVAFTRAGVAANSAVFPDQSPDTIKVFSQLVQFALKWRACDLETRKANAPRILELAGHVASRLRDENPRPPSPPAPPIAAPRQYKDDSFDDAESAA